ncbi:MAG: tetratricopeptide repeat protein [Elusimicrobiota bacterium]|nr:tetratricopeptide repeat protein [Elusimicrobiota bacterium]
MVKIRFALFPVLLGLVFFPAPAAAGPGCAGARELLNKGQALEAQKLLFGLPGELDAACIDALADAAIVLGDFKKAASALEELFRRDPSSLSAAARLARLYSWEGDYKASLRYYDAALALKPGDCELFVEKARVLAWAARFNESSAFYPAAEKACGAWVGSEAAGKANLRRGRICSAEKEYKKAVELNPGGSEALFDLAQLYSNSGVYGEAEKYYKLLAEIAPYNTAAARARAKNSAYRDDLRLEGGFSYWGARGSDRMTDVRRTGFYAGPAARIGEILSASAYGTYADYGFDSGAGLSERGGTAALAYAPSLYWGAGASVSARSLAGRGVSGPSSVYAWARAADPLTVSLALRRESLFNNRENIISGRGSSSVKARADLNLAAGISAGADLARGRVDGGNYYTVAGADAKYSMPGESSLSWAEGRLERSSYARGSSLYFAPSVYNTYSLEVAWRRYFSKSGVYYGAPHFYAEVKARETFDNSRYFSFNPRAALYAARDKYWTLKLEFSLTSSHYYRDNYWELALVKAF